MCLGLDLWLPKQVLSWWAFFIVMAGYRFLIVVSCALNIFLCKVTYFYPGHVIGRNVKPSQHAFFTRFFEQALITLV